MIDTSEAVEHWNAVTRRFVNSIDTRCIIPKKGINGYTKRDCRGVKNFFSTLPVVPEVINRTFTERIEKKTGLEHF